MLGSLALSFVIAAVSVSWKDVGLALLAATSAGLGVGWLVRKDTGVEERRRRMIELAGHMRKLGLEQLADAFEGYAVGDYSGVYADAKSLVKRMADPTQALELLGRVFYNQLPQRLAQDGDRDRILKEVGNFLLAHPDVRTKVLSDFDARLKEVASAVK